MFQLSQLCTLQENLYVVRVYISMWPAIKIFTVPTVDRSQDRQHGVLFSSTAAVGHKNWKAQIETTAKTTTTIITNFVPQAEQI